MREDNGFSLRMEEDTFSTENVRRIVSLMCASHMEHAMPEIFTVVRIIFVPSFKIESYPSATSSVIMALKPTAKKIVPMLECFPCDISGISSSTTT